MNSAPRSDVDRTVRESRELRMLRRCTHTGRPLGDSQFIRTLEMRTQRCLLPRPRGRPRQNPAEEIHGPTVANA